MFRARGVGVLLLCFLLAGCRDQAEITVGDSQNIIDDQNAGAPTTGDWLIIHALSDPEQLNPLTSNDAGSSEINGYIFESLLSRDPRTLELKPLLAEARPEISNDKLSYTFKIRNLRSGLCE